MRGFYRLEPEKFWSFPKSYKGDIVFETKQMILSGDYLGSVKKDGNYLRTVKEHDRITLQTRGVSKVTNEYGDKTDCLPHIVEELSTFDGDVVFLGEVYFEDVSKNDSDVGAVLRCLAPKAIQRQKNNGFLSYYVFDILYYKGADLRNTRFEQRVKLLNDLSDWFDKQKHIHKASFYKGQKLWEELVIALERGEEGIVMTKKDSVYEAGKRTSRKTLKVKKEINQPIDALFTGKYKPANRQYAGKDLLVWEYWQDIRTGEKIRGKKYKDFQKGSPIEPVTKPFFYGWAGSVEIGLYKKDTDEVFSLSWVSGLTDKIKEDIVINNKDYINRPCRMSCMEVTKDKALRHPKFIEFRDDIPWQDCSYDKVFEE